MELSYLLYDCHMMPKWHLFLQGTCQGKYLAASCKQSSGITIIARISLLPRNLPCQVAHLHINMLFFRQQNTAQTYTGQTEKLKKGGGGGNHPPTITS
jgi:hypothetical protein